MIDGILVKPKAGSVSEGGVSINEKTSVAATFALGHLVYPSHSPQVQMGMSRVDCETFSFLRIQLSHLIADLTIVDCIRLCPGVEILLYTPLLRLKAQSDDTLQCTGCDRTLFLSPGVAAQSLPSVGLRTTIVVTGIAIFENQLPLFYLNTPVHVVRILGNMTKEESGRQTPAYLRFQSLVTQCEHRLSAVCISAVLHTHSHFN